MIRMFSLMACLLAVAMLTAMAQRGGANNQPAMGGRTPATIMEMAPQGLFVLRGGILAKLDAKTLKEVAVVELFGAAPVRPTTQPARNAPPTPEWTKYYAEMAKRNAAPALLAAEKNLLIVIGDQFFRIDAETGKVAAKASLTPAPVVPADPNQPQPQPQPATNAAPLLEMNGTTLIVLNGMNVTAVNIEDGKILATGKLPEKMAPPQGGGRGGNQPANPPAAGPAVLG